MMHKCYQKTHKFLLNTMIIDIIISYLNFIFVLF